MLRDRALHIIFGVTLMGVIGISILAPAFPEIRDEFKVSDAEVGMLIAVFTFPGIFFAPTIGVIADRFGRRKILVPSLFLFAIAGVGCAFVDFKTMLLLRFLQGIGGSALTALSATLIGDIYEGMERAKALGYNASILAIGTASYPLIGGILVHFDWRLPFFTFFLAIPIGIAAATLPSPEVKPKEAFSAYFRNSMAILRKGKLLFEFISGAAVFIVLYGSFLLYLTFLLKDAYAADPCVIGVLLSSMSVFTAIFASKLGCFVKILGSVRTIGLGFACYSISMLLVPFIPSLPYFILVTFLFGLGHGTVLPALQNLVVSTAPMEYRAVVMTTYGSAIRIGQTAGPTIASISAFYSLNTVFFVSAIITALLAIAYCFVKD